MFPELSKLNGEKDENLVASGKPANLLKQSTGAGSIVSRMLEISSAKDLRVPKRKPSKPSRISTDFLLILCVNACCLSIASLSGSGQAGHCQFCSRHSQGQRFAYTRTFPQRKLCPKARARPIPHFSVNLKRIYMLPGDASHLGPLRPRPLK